MPTRLDSVRPKPAMNARSAELRLGKDEADTSPSRESCCMCSESSRKERDETGGIFMLHFFARVRCFGRLCELIRVTGMSKLSIPLTP